MCFLGDALSIHTSSIVSTSPTLRISSSHNDNIYWTLAVFTYGVCQINNRWLICTKPSFKLSHKRSHRLWIGYIPMNETSSVVTAAILVRCTSTCIWWWRAIPMPRSWYNCFREGALPYWWNLSSGLWVVCEHHCSFVAICYLILKVMDSILNVFLGGCIGHPYFIYRTD